MYKELKRSAHQQAQTNSKSRSSSAQEIKKLKPTCIETDQAQSKSSRSSAQQIEEVNQTERSRHIKSSRSSAQQMTEVKRTANGKGQTHIKYNHEKLSVRQGGGATLYHSKTVFMTSLNKIPAKANYNGLKNF